MTTQLQSPPAQSNLVDVSDRITPLWLRWFITLTDLVKPLNTGVSTTVLTAKLTVGGTNGSITYTKGVVTSQTPAT